MNRRFAYPGVEAFHWTALHFATTGISPSSTDIVGQLLAAGCDVNARSMNGKTPLQLLAATGDVTVHADDDQKAAVAKMLVEAGGCFIPCNVVF